MGFNKIVVVFLIGTLLADAMTHVIKTKRALRSSATTNQSEQPFLCEWSSPCGWAIYDRFTRDIQYFMRNHDCKCKEGTTCIRDDDDISIPGYVYRCREVPANATVLEDSL